MVVLNKIDLVDDEQLEKVRDWITSRMRRVRIVETVQCDVPLEILLGVGRFDPQQLAEAEGDRHSHPDHGQTFSTWSYETDRLVSLTALNDMVKKQLPGNIYRCKGIVYAAEHPEQRAVLQVVGRRADVALGEAWGDVQPRTQIVAITAVGSLDTARLTALFDGCVIEDAAVMG